MPLDKKLMEILACPKCKGPVEFGANDQIVCAACQLAYPIKDGIPVMLIDEAVSLER